jgi:hypothetical protein
VPNEAEPMREPFLKKWFFGSSVRAEREEKVLRYIIHRTNDEGALLREVVREDYVRRNCSQAEIEKIVEDPELVHACREHLWRAFESGELAPTLRPHAPLPSAHRRPPDRENNGASALPDA